MVKDAVSGSLKPFNFDNLLKQIPQLEAINAEIDTYSIPNPKDSADMHPEDWQFLGNKINDEYNNYDGFIVLHGTDTMAYTASALSFMFQNLSKPIILTGSQLPVGDIRTDALENVLTAIQIALLQNENKPLINEVGIYFDNQLLRGNRTIKISSEAFDAFSSPNYPALVTSGVSLKTNKNALWKLDKSKSVKFISGFDQNVFVLKIHPGLTEKMFQQFTNAVDFKVLILESYGSGTLFTANWLLKSIKKLIECKKIVINCSQCIKGSVEQGIYTTSEYLNSLGVISGKDITTEAALIKSMHLLAENLKYDEFKIAFKSSISGEIS